MRSWNTNKHIHTKACKRKEEEEKKINRVKVYIAYEGSQRFKLSIWTEQWKHQDIHKHHQLRRFYNTRLINRFRNIITQKAFCTLCLHRNDSWTATGSFIHIHKMRNGKRPNKSDDNFVFLSFFYLVHLLHAFHVLMILVDHGFLLIIIIICLFFHLWFFFSLGFTLLFLSFFFHLFFSLLLFDALLLGHMYKARELVFSFAVYNFGRYNFWSCIFLPEFSAYSFNLFR